MAVHSMHLSARRRNTFSCCSIWFLFWKQFQCSPLTLIFTILINSLYTRLYKIITFKNLKEKLLVFGSVTRILKLIQCIHFTLKIYSLQTFLEISASCFIFNAWTCVIRIIHTFQPRKKKTNDNDSKIMN